MLSQVTPDWHGSHGTAELRATIQRGEEAGEED